MPTLSILTFGTFCDVKLSLIIAKKFLNLKWNVVFITNSLPDTLVIKHKNITYILYDMTKYIDLTDSQIDANPSFLKILTYLPMIKYINFDLKYKILPHLQKSDYTLVHYPALIFNSFLYYIDNIGIFYVAPSYITSDIPFIFSNDILNFKPADIGKKVYNSSYTFSLKLSLLSGNPYNIKNIMNKADLYSMWDPVILNNITSIKKIHHLSNIVDTFTDQTKFNNPKCLTAFITTDNPIVYISFGSFLFKKKLFILKIIKSFISKGYTVLYHGNLDVKFNHKDLLIYSKFISHEWIIPKCFMIVSSGSYCMTSIANYYGVRILHIPMILEQIFWAKLYAYNTTTKYIKSKKTYTIDKIKGIISRLETCDKVRNYTDNLRLSIIKADPLTKLYNIINKKSKS